MAQIELRVNNPTLNLKSGTIPTDQRSKIWAEGTDEQVQALGGKHSAKGWATLVHNTRLQEWLYAMDYKNKDIDFEYCRQYFEEHFSNPNDNQPLGGCSAIHSGNYFGRNYDWTYGNEMSFVVRKEGNPQRFASIGMCGGIPALTKEIAESQRWVEQYKLLPYFFTDGVNEKGVSVSINVVPNDNGETTGTGTGNLVCLLMLPSMVLDKCSSVNDVFPLIASHNWFAPIIGNKRQEVHFLIADKNGATVIVEFINNKPKVLHEGTETQTTPYGDLIGLDKPINAITNFYYYGATFEDNGHINYDSVTDYGQGLERYDIIAEALPVSNMNNLLENLFFTNAYSQPWKTEFTGNWEKYGNLTVTTPLEQFATIMADAQEKYSQRNRNPESPYYGTWQTVHSVVYDLGKLSMQVKVQEGTEIYSCYLNDNINLLKSLQGFDATKEQVLKNVHGVLMWE